MKSICSAILTCFLLQVYAQELIPCLTEVPKLALQKTEILSYPRETVEIPIVFHIVYEDKTQSVSDELLLRQLEILNEDYNTQNSDLIKVPTEFRSKIGNPGISFCLASVNPENDSQTGILRTHTDIRNIANLNEEQDGFRRIKQSSLGGSSPWDPERYLNIWIGARDDNGLGDATFPTEEDPNKIDGIVISYHVIQELENESGKFNLGRTLTHEIGHYLNVLHLNGNESGCFNEGDFVADTPQQSENYFGQCGQPVSSCGSRDMDTNFMNFRNDNCLNFFTKGQVDRMMNTLFTTRFRLISSQICSSNSPIPTDPLALAGIFTFEQSISVALPTLRNREYKLELYDITGKLIEVRDTDPAHVYNYAYQDYPSGIYIVHLILENKHFARKLYLN